MDSSWIAFISAIVGALVGGGASILTTLITLQHQSKQARLAQEETRRTARQEYLIWLMHLLVEARTEYERLLGEVSGLSTDDAREPYKDQHANVVGKARAVCYAASDEELTRIAEDELTPYFVEEGDDPNGFKNYGDWKNRNVNGINKAVKRLAKLVAEA